MPPPKSFPLKVFFRFFPKTWWICLVVAAIMQIPAPGLTPLWHIVINLSATVLAFKLAVVIHESGHLLAAAAVGGIPKRIVLGTGHEIYRTDVRNVKVVLNAVPVGGLAYAVFSDELKRRWRYAIYIAGGVGMNLLVALALYLAFGFEPFYLTGRYGVQLSTALIVPNLVCLINLIPFYTSAFGTKLRSDGLALLLLPFKPKEVIYSFGDQLKFFDAFEHYENRDYDKAQQLYEEVLETNPGSYFALLNISALALRSGDHEKALRVLQELEQRRNEPDAKSHHGIVNNNLAWLHLIENDIDRAYPYALQAIRLMPKANFVNGTFGAVLIAKGDTDQGMRYLFHNVDFEHPNGHTLMASAFLAVAYARKGEPWNKEMHRQYVERNIDILENDDERRLAERCLKSLALSPKS